MKKGKKPPAHEARMEEARKLVQGRGRASTNFLGKELQISPRVAVRILDSLEAEGIIRRCTPSEKTGNSPWEVVPGKIVGEAKAEAERTEAERAGEDTANRARAKRRRDALKVVYKDLMTLEEEKKIGDAKVNLLLDLMSGMELSEQAQMRAIAALQDPNFHALYHRLLTFELELSLPAVYRQTRREAEAGIRDSRKEYLALVGKRATGGKFNEPPEVPSDIENMPDDQLFEEIRRRSRKAKIPGITVMDEEKL